MRILLLNQFYKPDTAATGQLLADLAEELAQRGHDVHVLWSMDVYPEVAVALGTMRNGGFLYRILLRLSKHLYRDSSCIISLGEVMTDRLVEAGAPRNKITTVHNWAPGEPV